MEGSGRSADDFTVPQISGITSGLEGIAKIRITSKGFATFSTK